MQGLGAQVKAERLRRGESQSVAAALIGTTYKTLGEWERGDTEPADTFRAAILEYVSGRSPARRLTTDEKRVQQAVGEFRMLAKLARQMAALADGAAEGLGAEATPGPGTAAYGLMGLQAADRADAAKQQTAAPARRKAQGR